MKNGRTDWINVWTVTMLESIIILTNKAIIIVKNVIVMVINLIPKDLFYRLSLKGYKIE